MGSLNNPAKFAWQFRQASVDLNPPTLNTLHEVFSETGGVRLYNIQVIQTNTPTNAEDVDIQIVIDGTTYLYDASAVVPLNNNDEYNAHFFAHDMATYPDAYDFDLETNITPMLSLDNTNVPFSGKGTPGHAISFHVRQTSAIAAGARIRAKASYELLVRVA